MKKIILLLTLMLVNASFVPAETLRFCVEYEEIKKERGELYQYSERYLGIKDVVLEDETVYVLTSIQLLSDSSLRPICPFFCKERKTPITSAEKSSKKWLSPAMRL